MKILNLKIFSPSKELIRDINFNKKGISIILGDILSPQDVKKTSNSLGKSLLLKLIDYIYGAKNDKKVVPEILDSYFLNAVVEFKNKKYLVERNLGDSSKIIIEENLYSLEEYKKFFEIERTLFRKQIILQPRLGLISYKANPEKQDMISFIRLLELEELVNETDKIYMSQDKIVELKKNKKQMFEFLNETDKIDEKIFILNKEIEKLEKEVSNISEKIKKLQMSEIKENIIEEYQIKNVNFKEMKELLFHNEIEIKRMEKFLKEYENIDVSSKKIFSLYEKTKIEIPDLVKRKIEEVEEFHKNVYSDRKKILSNRIRTLSTSQEEKTRELDLLKEELDYLGSIISENEIYIENIDLYEKYSHELKEKKYQQGQFSQIENVNNKISDEDSNLAVYFGNLKQLLSKEENRLKIEKIKNFVYDFTQNIYNYERGETSSYFKIEVRKKHQTTRPLKLEIKIDYDSGGGVGQVKKIMIDILILKFNILLNFFIQDSSAYEGIDPRQVTTIIFELDKIANSLNKQAIISINKYQVLDDEMTVNFLKDKEVIKLSEDDKLLKIDFK